MGNVLRILKRDILRLFKAPAALIVVAALLVLPSVYSWYNVVAFWNPYEATGNLKVNVVNEDAGAESELTGAIDIGERVTEELLATDRLDFTAADYDEAIADLQAGKVYAVYVIPEDFSECLISPLTGTVKKPTIHYYANEKLGPVSPKITDTAATTLEETINSEFVSTVSEAAVQAIDDALNKAAGDAEQARSVASARMDATLRTLSQVQDDLENARAAIDAARAKADEGASSMDDVKKTLADARTVLDDINEESDVVESQLVSVASDAANAVPDALAKAAKVESEVDAIADDLAALAETGRTRAGLAVDRLEAAADALDGLSTKLADIANALPEGWSASSSSSGSLTVGDTGGLIAGSLELAPTAVEAEVNTDVEAEGDASAVSAPAKSRLLAASRTIGDKASNLRKLLEKAKKVDGQLTDLSQAASEAASGLKGSAKQASEALNKYADGIFSGVVQSVVSTLAQVNAACARVSTALSGLDTTAGQVQSCMRQLSDLLGSSGEALSQTGGLVGGLRDDLGAVASDIRMLANSGALAELLGGGDLSPESISAFLGAPTKIDKVEFYHPNAYGTAMAPLFMNLTFWIGAFMLVIIFKLEVDDEGLKRVTLGQRYLSRLLLFSGLAVGQALICCAGVLVLGVQVAHVPALFLAAAFSSLAYIGIIYALSANLQHIGKALCIILVFAQIPGGSGLYPLELTDGFFQAVYPFLPFSYGIGALREAIFGFYGNYFAQDIAVLAAIAVSVLVLGLAVLPRMSNVTRMAARQIREGGLYNGEEAVVPARPYLLSQVVSVLADRDDYREGLERRYARFSRMYPIMIRASIALGIAVPVVLMFCMALDAGEKVVLLTVFLLWLVALVVFLLVVESLRYSFERQLDIDRMSDRSLVRLFLDRDRLKPALARVTGSDAAAAEEELGETGDQATIAHEPKNVASKTGNSVGKGGAAVESRGKSGGKTEEGRDA